MPKYVIERELPGAGKLSPEELQGADVGIALESIALC
jgi:hypothetical protein